MALFARARLVSVIKMSSKDHFLTRLAVNGSKRNWRAGLSLNYVLKYVGEVVLSGLPMFIARARKMEKMIALEEVVRKFVHNGCSLMSGGKCYILKASYFTR